MSRSMIVKGPHLATPVWAGDFLSRDHLVPSPAKVKAADFVAGTDGKKYIPAGTVLGLTRAKAAAGDPWEKATAAHEVVYIVAFDVNDAADINDVELVRHNAAIKENFLPGWDTVVAGVKLLVRSQYTCYLGQE